MKEKKRTIHKALWLVPILLVLVAASGWSFDYQQTFYDLMDQLFQIDSEGQISQVQSAWDTPVDFPVFIIRYEEPYLYSNDARFSGYNISYALHMEKDAVILPWDRSLLWVSAVPDRYEIEDDAMTLYFRETHIHSAEKYHAVHSMPLPPNDRLRVEKREYYPSYFYWGTPPLSGFGIFDGDEEIWAFWDTYTGIKQIVLDHGTIYAFGGNDGGRGFFNRGDYYTYLYVTQDRWQFFGGKGSGVMADVNKDGSHEMIVYIPFLGLGGPGLRSYAVYEIYWFDGHEYRLTETQEQLDAVSAFANREILEDRLANSHRNWDTDILEWIHYQIYAQRSKEEILNLLATYYPGRRLSIAGYMGT